MDHRRVAQHTHFCLRAILVAQPDGVANDLREMRMTGGLTVARKGQYIRQLSISHHRLQLGLQFLGHLLTGGEGQRRTVVLVEATLTIDTVERAHLAVGRQQVDAQRDAQPAAMHGAEDGRRIDNCTHNRLQRYKIVK